MKILLLTRNHVVREFVALVADRVEAELVVIEDASELKEGSFDFFFVDDRGGLLQQGIEILEQLDECRSILLCSKLSNGYKLFDIKVKKPFLPSDIQAILLDKQEEESAPQDKRVLNLEDIEEIKSLLEDDELETGIKGNIAKANINTHTKHKKKKKKKKHKIISGEKFLQTILKMDKKDTRALLSDAEVTITIKFPKVK